MGGNLIEQWQISVACVCSSLFLAGLAWLVTIVWTECLRKVTPPGGGIEEEI